MLFIYLFFFVLTTPRGNARLRFSEIVFTTPSAFSIRYTYIGKKIKLFYTYTRIFFFFFCCRATGPRQFRGTNKRKKVNK